MKINASQLDRQLQSPLPPIFIVSGDEPLLCQEAADAIRKACREQGFTEREVFHVDNGFDWTQLRDASAALSLFGDRRLLELRIPNGKPGDKGAAALLTYLDRPADDSVLLITLPKLDAATQRSKWAKAMIDSELTRFIPIWPIDSAHLPQWIRQRLSRAGLSVDEHALELIVARVEGNLLAAAQEIEKLCLLTEDRTVTAAIIQASVADNARFDVFGLLDTALAGNAAHAQHILSGLRSEGIEPPVILWSLTRELRQLSNIALQQARGIPLDKAFSQARPPIWDKRRPLYAKALPRQSSRGWNRLLQAAQVIDAQIKGQAPGDPWNGLSRLLMLMAGRPFVIAETDT